MTLRDYAEEVGAPFERPCLLHWLEHRHSISQRRALFPVTCKQRDLCVTCAITYGREQGAELFTLIEADLDRLRHELREGEPLSWQVDFTFPATMRGVFRRLQEEKRKRELSKLMKAVGELIRAYLAHLFQCKPSELGVSINWQDWSTENPLGDAKFHVHTIVPNVTGAGFKLSTLGSQPEQRVKSARKLWKDGLNELFPEMRIPEELDVNVFVEFNLNNKEGWNRLKHDCSYVARSAFEDVLKDSKKRPSFFHEPERYKAFLVRSRFMQRLKTRRYLGHLAPGQRKRYGLIRTELKEGRVWQPVERGGRKLVRVTDTGFLMVKYVLTWDGPKWEEVEVPAALIEAPHMPGRAWKYDEDYNDSS